MEQKKFAIINFYDFVAINEPNILMQKLLFLAKKKSIYGTIILSLEGVNGSITSDNKDDLDCLINEIYKNTSSTDLNCKLNYCDKQPFDRMKIKIKPEIISFRVGEIDINSLKGTYIDSKNWDNFISQDDVVVIDTRNDYEISVGTFDGSINPKITKFTQLCSWIHDNSHLFSKKKIAMFCTGGIRCEKSTSYMRSLGYNDVYHLKGGIIQYLADTENKNNKWIGKCFVFDHRIALEDNLSPVDSEYFSNIKEDPVLYERLGLS